MISRIVNSLLKTEKRVTVPALGTFIKRNDGVVVFTDMLKDDDGVLAAAVASKMSITPVEALSDIAKFVEQVGRNLRERGIAELSDLGILTRNTQGGVILVSNEPVKQTEVQPEVVASVQQPKTPETTPVQPQEKQVTVVVEKPIAMENKAPQAPKRPNVPVKKSVPTAKPKRDWVLIIAIGAALIALACMAFGIFEGNVTSIILE